MANIKTQSRKFRMISWPLLKYLLKQNIFKNLFLSIFLLVIMLGGLLMVTIIITPGIQFNLTIVGLTLIPTTTFLFSVVPLMVFEMRQTSLIKRFGVSKLSLFQFYMTMIITPILIGSVIFGASMGLGILLGGIIQKTLMESPSNKILVAYSNMYSIWFFILNSFLFIVMVSLVCIIIGSTVTSNGMQQFISFAFLLFVPMLGGAMFAISFILGISDWLAYFIPISGVIYGIGISLANTSGMLNEIMSLSISSITIIASILLIWRFANFRGIR